MALTKRQVSISLDEDLVAALKAQDESLSAQVNAAVRKELEHRHRRRLLSELLDRLDRAHSPIDEALVGKYTQLIS